MDLTIEERVEKIRKEKRIMKKTVYSALGVTATGYDHMIKKKTMAVRHLPILAEVLEVDIVELIQSSSIAKENSLDSDKTDYKELYIDALEKNIKTLEKSVRVLERNYQISINHQDSLHNEVALLKERLEITEDKLSDCQKLHAKTHELELGKHNASDRLRLQSEANKAA